MRASDNTPKSPDFAFPATVSQDAKAELDIAVKQNNASAALEALLKYDVAQVLIDPSNAGEVIKLTEETAGKFANSPLNGLFDALLANLYCKVYNERSYLYDRRELPLMPYPEDITEWSGRQFKQKIKDYALSSVSGDKARALAQLSTKDYQNVVNILPVSLIFYPTLLDFAYSNAISLLSKIGDDAQVKSLYEEAIAANDPASAPYILFTTDYYLSLSKSKELIENYDKYAGNRYVPYMIIRLSNSNFNYPVEQVIDDDDVWTQDESSKNMVREKWLYKQINRYLADFPDGVLVDNLKTIVKTILKAEAECEYSTYCTPGEEFSLKVTAKNAEKIRLKVYSISESRAKSNLRVADMKSMQPLKTIDFTFVDTKPFAVDTSATIKIDNPGYYVIVTEVDGKVNDKSQLEPFRCVPAIPTAFSSVKNPVVTVANPYTSQPFPNAEVLLKRDRKVVSQGYFTDKKGISWLSSMPGDRNMNINLRMDGQVYDFDYFTVNKNDFSGNSYINKRSQIFTDKAIYHPGDKVQALLVASKSDIKSDVTHDVSTMADADVVATVYDANYQMVKEISGKTDDFGRFAFDFDLPTEGLTGRFRISVRADGDHTGETSFMVSDYKMPEFEINISAIAHDIPAKGDVTISGVAKTYSGMPVANANINTEVSMSSWRFWSYNPNQKIFSAETTTDESGRFVITVPDSVLSNNNFSFFTAKIDATALNGSAANTSASFSTGKQFYIDMSIGQSNIDALKPLRPEVKVYAPGDSIVEIPLLWRLEQGKNIVASGDFTGSVDLSKITPGSYKFVIAPVDPELADEMSACIMIYNLKTDIVPGDTPIWVMQTSYSRDKGKPAEIVYGTPQGDTYVYYVVVWDNEIRKIDNVECAKGYHTLKIDIPDNVDNAFVTLYTMKDFKRACYDIDIRTKEDYGLKIVGESFRDKLQPGTQETWRFRIVKPDGSPCNAAVALDMYNKALDALYPNRYNIGFYRTGAYNPLYVNYIYNGSNSSEYIESIKGNFTNLQSPDFMYIDRFGVIMELSCNVSYSMAPTAGPNRFKGCARVSQSVDYYEASVEESSAAFFDEEAKVSDSEPVTEPEKFDYRDSEVTLAIWAPTLTTDKDGNLTYSFTVPNANTTWRLQAIAWTKDAYAGSLVRDFVASKAVMVQPNLPRFLRVGDKARVLATVMNNTDSIATIKTVVEIFNPVTSEIISTEEFTNTLEGKTSAVVGVDIAAPGNLGAIGYRIRSGNGRFSDGEQSVIRILPNENALVETIPFYLNPGETEYSMTLPTAKDARISFTFCENPAWTIVTALPGLRTEIDDYANSAAAALFSACVARGIVKENPAIGKAIKLWSENPTDSALVSMLQKNEDLKIALLNATPWVQAAQSDTERMANLTLLFDEKETGDAIKKALNILVDLQKPDGGWKWGKWCDRSSEWVTGNVLTMLARLKTLGWLPSDNRVNKMITNALRFWDKEVEDTDVIYAIVRPQFADVTISSNGMKVINKTISEIRKDWKSYSSPSYKAMAAEALYMNNDKKLANELMRSISEFGVWTKSQGLRFPSVDALYSYGIILEAYAMIQPQAKEVDGLRQQLIVRKQGTNWGNAVVTTEVVQSILSSGSTWTVDAKGATVKAGTTVIAPATPMETATGNIRADLTPYAGDELTVTTTGAGPAYGAVYAQFSQLMSDVKAFSCDDLDIEKVMFVRDGLEWKPATELHVGDRVKVHLTIHCKRNLQYVEIVDERPAAFEPVQQLPGWVWSEGTAFYRENRDSRTQLHVAWLNPGTYLLTYEMNVNTAGTYSSGVASIQSQYAPEISAHSSGQLLSVSE